MALDSNQIQREWPLFYPGNVLEDNRGSFRELFSNSRLRSVGIEIPPIQQVNSIIGNHLSIRGFHAHEDGWKILSCISGEITEAFLDLREESNDFGKSYSVKLSENDGTIVVIPPKVAHAFQVTSHTASIIYVTSAEYSEGSEIDINPMSAEVKKFWLTPGIISDRDTKSIDLGEFLQKNWS